MDAINGPTYAPNPSWNPMKHLRKNLESGSRSGRASPLVVVLDAPNQERDVACPKVEPPRLRNFRPSDIDSRSSQPSPLTLVRSTQQLLDKSAQKLAHLKLQDSTSGRSSPVISQLSLRAVNYHSTRAEIEPPKTVAAQVPPPHPTSTSAFIRRKVDGTANASDSKTPVNFFQKYADSDSASGCHTPTASYPGLDRTTLESMRRRQEDLRRKFHTQSLISV